MGPQYANDTRRGSAPRVAATGCWPKRQAEGVCCGTESTACCPPDFNWQFLGRKALVGFIGRWTVSIRELGRFLTRGRCGDCCRCRSFHKRSEARSACGVSSPRRGIGDFHSPWNGVLPTSEILARTLQTGSMEVLGVANLYATRMKSLLFLFSRACDADIFLSSRMELIDVHFTFCFCLMRWSLVEWPQLSSRSVIWHCQIRVWRWNVFF